MGEWALIIQLAESVGPGVLAGAIVMAFLMRRSPSVRVPEKSDGFSAKQQLWLRDNVTDPIMQQGREILEEVRKVGS